MVRSTNSCCFSMGLLRRFPCATRLLVMSRIRFALAQLNPIVGDVTGNSLAIVDAVADSYARGARVIVTPEMSVTGYPADDLASSTDFIRQSEAGVNSLAARLASDGFGDAVVIVGYLSEAAETEFGGARAHNSLAVLHEGRVVATYAKRHLPNYSVFDEERVFVPGHGTLVLEMGGVLTGFLICEDLWRSDGPVAELAARDLDAVVVINASPFDTGKDETRFPLLATRAVEFGATVIYVNSVGGQDDLVFDGDSAVLDASGSTQLRAKRFDSALELIDIRGNGESTDGLALAEPDDDITP
ncbi:MAG: NAD+ synthase, partial [Actinobacteria bacterium]|nr:NAD+ synthase [Actinomycetota bacterium]